MNYLVGLLERNQSDILRGAHRSTLVLWHTFLHPALCFQPGWQMIHFGHFDLGCKSSHPPEEVSRPCDGPSCESGLRRDSLEVPVASHLFNAPPRKYFRIGPRACPHMSRASSLKGT